LALIQAVTLPTGEIGDYWRIIQITDHADRGTVAELQLYKAKTVQPAQRLQPLSLSYQFVFTIEEIELADFDPDNPVSLRGIMYHAHYQAIKALAISAHGKEDIDRTANESAALMFYGAAND